MNNILVTILQIIIPLVTLIIGIYFQKQRDKLLIEQETFFQKKRENYFKVIEPIVLMISNASNKKEQEKVTQKILTNDYRKEVLALSLYGNDSVVQSFNNLFQFIYNEIKLKENPTLLIPLLGKILVEMRKELGNKDTVLDKFEILEFLIKDIKDLKTNNKKEYSTLLNFLKK